MNSTSATPLRRYATIFALVLGLQSVWLLTPELIRPRLPFFPTGRIEAQSLTTSNSAATFSAWIGWPRGDLWIDHAMVVNAALLDNIENGASHEAEKTSNRQTSMAEYAASLAPYDSRAWLILAAVNIQSGIETNKTLAQLEMSYYTAPNDIRLMPFRIQIATRSSLIGENDLQSFVENDLRTIVKQQPDFKNLIAVAYRGASPDGRHFLVSKLTEIDPAFLSELQAAKL
jgi:hypothetical protein